MLRWLFAGVTATAFALVSIDESNALFALARDRWRELQDRLPGLPGAVVAALIAAVVAVIALRTAAAVNIRNKRMDVILHCNARYDELYKLRHDIDKETKPATQEHLVRAYFRRYWGLQSDQIDYWLAGYIDPETMASWIVSLTSSLKDKEVGGSKFKLSYSASWDKKMIEVHRVVNERLTETVDFAQRYLTAIDDPKIQYSVTLQYLRIVEANERALTKRLSRDHHRRMTVDDLARTTRRPYWIQYKKFDTRLPPFLWLRSIQGIFSRLIDSIPDWLMGNRLDRLRRKLESEGHLSSNSIAVIEESPRFPASDPGSPHAG